MNNQDFSQKTKDELMLRAGLRCCNPSCRRITVAFNGVEISKIGEAAHIRANSSGGPRYIQGYDATRIENGIWLCADCHSLVDKSENISTFSVSVLEEWKRKSENEYFVYLSQPRLDFGKYLSDKEISGTILNLNDLSDIQIALFIYCCNDKTINYCFSIDPDKDSFFDFYEEFYEWLVDSNQDTLRKRLQLSNLPSVIKLQKAQEQTTYFSVKELITSALISDNLRKIVHVSNNTITLGLETIYEKVFLDDDSKLDSFIDYWTK